jgi:hypothetical protein
MSDFLLLAIQIAEGIDAAHAEGGFIFGGFEGQCVLPVSFLTEQRVAEPPKNWASNARGSPEPDSWRGVLRFAALLSRRQRA